jgi:hypothetical protein
LSFIYLKSEKLEAQVDKIKTITPNQKILDKFFPNSYATSLNASIRKPIEVKVDDESIDQSKVEKNEVEDTEKKNLEFQTSDVSKKFFLPPDQTPSVPVNPDAPSSIISMIESNRRGDQVGAKAYAKQFVRMLQNYFFEVKEMTSLIGDALIEEKVIKDEDWIGAAQAIDIELAKTRLEKGISIKPTHDVAMKRIVPDPKKEVEAYFIFSRSCSWCRYMGSDVERLKRVFEGDTRVKFTGLVVGDSDEVWLKEFRDYTGLSIPVFDGTEFSKQFKLRFLPVLLVVTPNGQRSYFKSGQQNFERMYEFIRVAQGLPIEDSSKIQSVIKTPMGEGDKLILAKEGDGVLKKNFSNGSAKEASSVSFPEELKKTVQVDKF